MPELPEVETMVDRLQQYVGRDVWYIAPFGSADPKRYNDRSFDPAQRLHGVFRRGKFMIFMLEDCALLAHNAMSGYWDDMDAPWTFDYVEGKRTSNSSDVRATMEVSERDGPKSSVLQFHDARKFGYVHVVSPDLLAEKLTKLGPEMIRTKNLYEPSAVIAPGHFAQLIGTSKKPVKEVLMDQNVVAGLGNIYAAEACWAARVSPFRIGNTLSMLELDRLYHSCRMVLEGALERRLNYDGLKIYRREKCPMCGTEVEAEKLKGRTTYWCSKCQH